MLKIVSYNILFSKNTDKIIQTILEFADKGATAFCLQEVVLIDDKAFIIDILLGKLGHNWKAIYNVGRGDVYQNHGTCILWNTRILQYRSHKAYFLPKLQALALHENIFTLLAGHRPKPMLRRSISGVFRYKNRDIKITSLHLDHVGGLMHRNKQLRYLMHQKNEEKVKYEIYCGDFNSFDLLRTGAEKKLLIESFGPDFEEASDKIKWTADLYNTESLGRQTIFLKLIKIFHLHLRRKLDYIWVKNFKVLKTHAINVKGSDHLPIIATLKIGRQ
jgi:endonuclease/exonuclease/phosphatase family metal-dependent hydrolase